MKIAFCVLFALILFLGAFCEADEFDSFAEDLDDEDSSNDEVGSDRSDQSQDDDLGVGEDNSEGSSSDSDTTSSRDNNLQDSGNTGSSYKYTREYYVAWGFGGLGLLILLVLFYLLLRQPKNRWEK